MDSTESKFRRIWRLIHERRTKILLFGGPVLAFSLGVVMVLAIYEYDRIRERLSGLIATETLDLADTALVDWEKVETVLVTAEKAELPLGDVDGGVPGGGIDEFAGHVIYVSGTGQIATYDLAGGALVYSDQRAPMDFERLRANVFANHPEFNVNFFRVHDILVWPTGAETADLLVSHQVFRENDASICNVISRLPVSGRNGSVELSGDWDEIYRMEPCISLPEIEWRFSGLLSGGRMVRQDETHILLSVGDFGFGTGLEHNKPDPDRVAASNPGHLGKILRINIESGDIEIFAGGFRNPQGLAMGADGRIWETEHGIQGGDEVNLIERDADYGWPYVTLGTQYGAPREPFPNSEAQGRHDGYRKPAHAFMPSVAISGMTKCQCDIAFPEWANDLLAVSLKGESLYRMRTNGDAIIYSEPVPLGTRMRDIVLLSNGWIAILGDQKSLIFLRDPRVSPSAPLITVSGYDAIEPRIAAASLHTDHASWGRDRFRAVCSQCHRLDGVIDVGPPLDGISRRIIGSYPNYPYTEALLSTDRAWTHDRLVRYLIDPKGAIPGTSMSDMQLGKWEADAIAEYLASIKPYKSAVIDEP